MVWVPEPQEGPWLMSFSREGDLVLKATLLLPAPAHPGWDVLSLTPLLGIPQGPRVSQQCVNPASCQLQSQAVGQVGSGAGRGWCLLPPAPASPPRLCSMPAAPSGSLPLAGWGPPVSVLPSRQPSSLPGHYYRAGGSQSSWLHKSYPLQSCQAQVGKLRLRERAELGQGAGTQTSSAFPQARALSPTAVTPSGVGWAPWGSQTDSTPFCPFYRKKD